MFLQILAEQAEHTLKLKDKCLNNLISCSTRKKSYFLFILAHRWLIINFLLRNSDSGWAFGGFETFRMYWKKNRCNSSSLQLSRQYTGASSGAPPVQPVLKNLVQATWHALWVVAWWLHRCINLGTTGASGATDLLAPALRIAPVLWHWCIRAPPDRPVLTHRFNRCNWFL